MHGVATGWLRYKQPTETERPTVPIFVRKSQFRLPFKPSVPVILVGPGTGLAPMRGFIQDRYSVHKDGKTVLLALCCVQTCSLFMQPPMRRMYICFTDVFFGFFSVFFPFATKIPDNCSRERLNGFS